MAFRYSSENMKAAGLLLRAKKFMKKYISSRYAMTAAVCFGGIGMLMILFSGGNADENNTAAEPQTSAVWEDYRRSTEQQLEAILSAIDGVGDADVMVTIGSSEEYIYAETERSKDGSVTEREYVSLKKGSSEEALIKKVKSPVITGVVVVCDGGKSSRVCEKVCRAVTAALNIPTSRIYVAEKN